MPIKREELAEVLSLRFPDSEIEIDDLAGDDEHYKATITSSAFADKSRIEQHRLVQEAVAGHDIHALSIKTIAKG